MKRFPFAMDFQQEFASAKLLPKGFGGWAVISVLPLLLIAAGVIGYLGWTITDVEVPASGYVAMALGVIFSLIVGVGLMALVFYSSREGYDKPAELIREPGETKDVETRPEHER